ALRHLAERPDVALPGPDAVAPDEFLRDRVFYSPKPLAAAGGVAFVFPGSGNHFHGMGRDLAVCWPAAIRRQQLENESLRDQVAPDVFWNEHRSEPVDARSAIFGQVTLGALVADVLSLFGIHACAAIGYSLGESAGLFALRAWIDRDEMF